MYAVYTFTIHNNIMTRSRSKYIYNTRYYYFGFIPVSVMGLRLKAEKLRIYIYMYIIYNILYLHLVSFGRVRDVSPYFYPSVVAVKQISLRVCNYFKPLLARVRGIGRYGSDIIHIYFYFIRSVSSIINE